MIGNRLRRIWAEGRASSNGWLGVAGNPFVAEIMAEQGFDSLTIDLPAWGARLCRGPADAAGDAGEQGRAAGPGALAGAGHHHEGARCRGLWHRLPDDQFLGPSARAGPVAALSARGDRSFEPTRAVLAAGQDYAAEANRGDPCLRPDRDGEARRRSGRSWRPRARRHLCRPGRPDAEPVAGTAPALDREARDDRGLPDHPRRPARRGDCGQPCIAGPQTMRRGRWAGASTWSRSPPTWPCFRLAARGSVERFKGADRGPEAPPAAIGSY